MNERQLFNEACLIKSQTSFIHETVFTRSVAEQTRVFILSFPSAYALAFCLSLHTHTRFFMKCRAAAGCAAHRTHLCRMNLSLFRMTTQVREMGVVWGGERGKWVCFGDVGVVCGIERWEWNGWVKCWHWVSISVLPHCLLLQFFTFR